MNRYALVITDAQTGKVMASMLHKAASFEDAEQFAIECYGEQVEVIPMEGKENLGDTVARTGYNVFDDYLQ